MSSLSAKDGSFVSVLLLRLLMSLRERKRVGEREIGRVILQWAELEEEYIEEEK